MQQECRAVLISVHPQYVRKILDGSKRVEFRRLWAGKRVTHLVLYSTSPEMKIVATLEITKVIKGSKTMLWEAAKQYGGGVTRSELRNYFSGVAEGYAILLDNVRQFKKPLLLDDAIPGVRVPQSYTYLTNDQFDSIQEMIYLEK